MLVILTKNYSQKLDNNRKSMSENNEKTTDTTSRPASIKLTGRMLNFSRLQLQGDDLTELFEKIGEKFSKQPNSKLPVVVSYDGEIVLSELWQKLWEQGLQPIGIIPTNDEQAEQAQAEKIAVFPADGQRIDGKSKKQTKEPEKDNNEKSAQTETSDEKPNESSNTSDENADKKTAENTDNDNQSKDESNSPSQDNNDNLENTDTNKFTVSYNEHSQNVEGDLVHHQMLRSGQSINHVGGDVILTKGVNAGAEAITDYSLHIYGKAEGRLVAGATGDKNARIFCMKFNPSLVSVAGTYCLKENIPAEFLNKAVEVSFDDEKGLVFSLIE